MIGRPPKNPDDMKKKIHVTVDPEIYRHLETLDNKSEFMNKAAWILFNAHKRLEAQNGKAAGDSSEGKGTGGSQKTA